MLDERRYIEFKDNIASRFLLAAMFLAIVLMAAGALFLLYHAANAVFMAVPEVVGYLLSTL